MIIKGAFNSAPNVGEGRFNIAGMFSALCAVPALTIMLYSRKRLGFNTTSYVTLFTLWIGMSAVGLQGLFWSGVFGAVVNQNVQISSILSHIDPWLLIFAQSVLAVGIVTHLRRLREFKSGILWYSYSGGIPRVASLFPKIKPYIIRRVIEPAAIFVLGLGIMLLFSTLLGLWLCWSAICLAIYEQIEADERFHMAIDVGDAIMASNCEIAAGLGFEEGEEPSAYDMAEAMDRQQKELHQVAAEFGVTADENADEIRVNLERRRRRQKQTHAIDYGAPKPGLLANGGKAEVAGA